MFPGQKFVQSPGDTKYRFMCVPKKTGKKLTSCIWEIRKLRTIKWSGRATEEPPALQDKSDLLEWDPPRSESRDLDIQVQGLSEK